jgi:hypothetical protein
MDNHEVLNPLISSPPSSLTTAKASSLRKRESVSVRVNLISNHLLKTKRLNDRNNNEVMIMEHDELGSNTIRTLSLRDLLLYVDKMASLIDSSLNFDSNNTPDMIVSSLQHRDLRRLDFHYNAEEEPIVIVRRHAVLIAFDPLRAIIMADRMIIIVPPGADEILNTLKENMNAWTETKKKSEDNQISTRIKRSSSVTSDTDESFTLPFESHAYEVIIATVYSLQLQEYEIMSSQINKLLSHFNYAIGITILIINITLIIIIIISINTSTRNNEIIKKQNYANNRKDT